MPAFKGGRKNRKYPKSGTSKREMIYKEQEQEYGYVEKLLGDRRCNVILPDKTALQCRICGSFKRRVWINQGDIVLVSRRSFEDKGDIIHKYNPDEAATLKAMGEIEEYNENEAMNEEETNDLLDDDELDILDL